MQPCLRPIAELWRSMVRAAPPPSPCMQACCISRPTRPASPPSWGPPSQWPSSRSSTSRRHRWAAVQVGVEGCSPAVLRAAPSAQVGAEGAGSGAGSSRPELATGSRTPGQ